MTDATTIAALLVAVVILVPALLAVTFSWRSEQRKRLEMSDRLDAYKAVLVASDNLAGSVTVEAIRLRHENERLRRLLAQQFPVATTDADVVHLFPEPPNPE